MIHALWITVIGMSLVFAAILLLWGLMALLVRLTADRPAAPGGAPPAPAAEPLPVSAAEDTGEEANRVLRRRAAAAGAAAALALRGGQPAPGGVQPSSNLSAWQAVQRAGALRQHRASRPKGTP